MLNLQAGHGPVRSLTFSPDATILVAEDPGGLYFFRGLPNPVRSERAGSQAVFIPGTRRVLMIDEPVGLWDLVTGAEDVVPFGPGYHPMGTATPDGRFVLFTRIAEKRQKRRAMLFARDANDLTREDACWTRRASGDPGLQPMPRRGRGRLHQRGGVRTPGVRRLDGAAAALLAAEPT